MILMFCYLVDKNATYGEKTVSVPFYWLEVWLIPTSRFLRTKHSKNREKMIALIFISVQFATGMIKHTKNFIYNIYIIRMYIK